MKILAWHVHAAWMTSFVQGPHEYYVPLLPDRSEDGKGRAQTYHWPASVQELTPAQLAATEIDVVVLQRPRELELFQRWTGRSLGSRGVPAVYVEHNTPRGDVNEWQHVLAARSDIPIAHVTEFNRMVWDNGIAPSLVVAHGVPDQGYRYVGDERSLGVAVNEPVRRWHVAGLDLVAEVATRVPVAVYGLGADELRGRIGEGLAAVDDLSQQELHQRLARHFAYLHPFRWTSLGLSLIEAMTLGAPVLVNGSTAAYEAVAPGTGLVSTNPDRLAETARRWLADPDEAREVGRAARDHALRAFGLIRFLDDWDRLLKEVCR
ncbi:glycosyltransferase [Kribbella sp. CA-293567]|uniref:glycosyltransferase n=1 Tax=Kribbella sp. CA-293567 TaxID=3002436 RepID=UPI0022DE4137|nr:glycosyltransferase [Kribbella sp. CA-293567]WBQ08307.1 glycosyltransferase [Kribbella sp. CA-293567]